MWLSAAHIEASMTLLKQSFPEMSGLQSTFCAVSSIRKFSFQPEESIQIHHDQDRSHWVTSCYVGGEVKLYDSMYQKGKGISSSLEKQLKAVYGETVAEQGYLKVVVPSVQQQRGTSDCGVFTVAFLFHLALPCSYPFFVIPTLQFIEQHKDRNKVGMR